MAQVIKIEKRQLTEDEQVELNQMHSEFTELMACDITGRCEGARCEYYGSHCGNRIGGY